MRAQLADSVKENKKLRGGIFSMWPNLPYNSSEMKGTDRVMFVGMLTGRPEEEVFGSSSDLLQGLSQMHERARQGCEVLPRPYGHPPLLQEVWRNLYSYLRERGGVSNYGRYLPVEKVQGKLGPW